MPKWTYSITIVNGTDRTLELVSSMIPWGNAEKPFPNSIAPGNHEEFCVYSPAGALYGLEFYFSMRDKPSEPGEPQYGTFSVAVDIPYWKTENNSSFKCTGILVQNGFEKIPDGAHDFSTTVTVSTTLCEALTAGKEEQVTAQYCRLYDWDRVEQLEVIDPAEKTVDDFIPASNLFLNRKTVARTDKISVPKDLWNQIIDRKFPDAYSKKNFVKDYFTVSAYEIRKNISISIAANQSYEKTLEISNRSTVRRETRTEFQIENTISAEAQSKKASLSETLRMQYQISELKEYCSEDMKTMREVFYYNAMDYDREVVRWDLVEIVSLYHVTKTGKTELVGVGDYYITATQKTYLDDGKTEIHDNGQECFICANSQTIYQMDPEDLYDTEESLLKMIAGSITINGKKYKWMEKSFGSNRGIEFNPDRHIYKFMPDPHDDPKYSKDTMKWYSAMAEAIRKIGEARHWETADWDQTIRGLKVNGITYSAQPR